jgi:hypothetical protein
MCVLHAQGNDEVVVSQKVEKYLLKKIGGKYDANKIYCWQRDQPSLREVSFSSYRSFSRREKGAVSVSVPQMSDLLSVL